MIRTAELWVGLPSTARSDRGPMLRGLGHASQGWTWDAGLTLAELGQLRWCPSMRADLVAVHEAAMLALDHAATVAGVRDDCRGLAASTLAQHHVILPSEPS